MATKVDRTASMLCRKHGCSSESLARRVMTLESENAALKEALADNAGAGFWFRGWEKAREQLQEKGKDADQ